jgi:hypothetical protein
VSAYQTDNMSLDLNTIRDIRIYGEAGPNEPQFWVHTLTGDVNQSCGELFGPVFEQYNYVYVFSTEATRYYRIPEYRLHEDSYLLQVMCTLNMNLREGVVEVWVRNRDTV